MNIKLVKNYNQIRPDRATLFCFPFAGGGASAYNSWVQKMKDKVTVCPIQLPGREERIMEKPYNNMTDIIKLTAPHDVMISHPEEVAKILLEN